MRRLEAQQACLELAAGVIADLPGPVLEIGLGNGRTYDHLRLLLPGREIFVFERAVAAHPDCTPDAAHLFLGDLRDTLPLARARLGSIAALVHIDIGTGDAAVNAQAAALIAPALAGLARLGAVVAADQRLQAPALVPMAPPPAVAPARYFLYRVDPCGPG
ncbi:MAG: hypothetical protein EXQ89_03695 [Rhodospirillaceae bacterium]|nr:hypothetical protein [Rhodospirillaceae bacterium]